MENVLVMEVEKCDVRNLRENLKAHLDGFLGNELRTILNQMANKEDLCGLLYQVFPFE